MRVREVRSEEASCPSVNELKGSGRRPVLLGALGVPCPLSQGEEEGGGIS